MAAVSISPSLLCSPFFLDFFFCDWCYFRWDFILFYYDYSVLYYTLGDLGKPSYVFSLLAENTLQGSAHFLWGCFFVANFMLLFFL